MAAVRQNYHDESEAGVNKQINLELYASYTYLSMAFHFDQSSVAHPGAHKYFKKASDKERHHAMLLMKFQNQRGGTIVLQNVKKPENDSWGSLKDAVQAALELEKHVNQSLLDLHALANKHGDTQMSDFIEDNFLDERVQAIKELGDYLTQLNRVGTGLGEFIFDHETLA
ncbi:soma ferritin-like [Asterias rubens]|uniref:soma ferritin-like n=1 Tax=Asterias rubens TaxID=7604 RepID=UPI00145583C6|nr:soma ferritin-like [Asterias rubens]